MLYCVMLCQKALSRNYVFHLLLGTDMQNHNQITQHLAILRNIFFIIMNETNITSEIFFY